MLPPNENSSPSMAAVVVSYNRRDLLRASLKALESQTRPPSEIIVVDNGSTDGAPELVRSEFPTVTLFETGANLGGAGGFAWGVELAIARGHDYAWLMDDDAEPEPDALEKLADVVTGSSTEWSFLASLVTADEKTANRGNPPSFSSDVTKQYSASKAGGIAIESATFVGVLINLATARRTHLPCRDYFIWVDDLEYTNRLAQLAPALLVPESHVRHPLSKSGSKDMGARLYYYLRNHLWAIRSATSMTTARKIFDALGYIQISFVQVRHARSRQVWAASFFKGLTRGLFASASELAPGSLLAELPEERRAALVAGR